MGAEAMMFPGSYWYLFAAAFTSSYFITVLLITALYVLKKDWRQEILNWLYVFNTIFVWVSLVNLLSLATDLFMAWYGQNSYEWYAFKENGLNFFSPYGWPYWLLFYSSFLLPQLFWLRRLRSSIWFSFLLLILLNVWLWERIVIFITSAYRDFLPSYWSTNKHSTQPVLDIIVQYGAVLIVLFFMYWFFNKRKKLPFKSAFLSYCLFFISYSLSFCIQHFN